MSPTRPTTVPATTTTIPTPTTSAPTGPVVPAAATARPRTAGRLAVAAGFALTALLGLTACASGHAVVSPAAAVQHRTLTDADAGATVHVTPGSEVDLVLHSTYWSTPRSSATALLAPGGASTSPSSGPSCRPGSGCGSVDARFTARSAGTVRITAQRSNCGEARRCTPAQADFTVTVVIGPAS